MIALEKSSLQKVRSKLAFLNDRDSFLITWLPLPATLTQAPN
jgi:hypothetical protein